MGYAHADNSLRGVDREMKKEDADQLIRCVKECWWRVAILFFLIFGFALLAIFGLPSFEFDQTAAAWVQAIGSLLALVIAIAVVGLTHFLAVRRAIIIEAHEERRMLISLRDELGVRYQQYDVMIGSFLDSIPHDKPIDINWNPPEKPFDVYYALIGKIALIKDSELRRKIIACYAIAEGLLATFRTNSRVYEERKKGPDSSKFSDPRDYMNEANRLYSVHLEYSKTLRLHHVMVRNNLTGLMEYIGEVTKTNYERIEFL